MITSLKINNIALIEESKINLSEGFNVLTGETGAGKSIIVDSLNFVLGSKADKGLIKTGKDFAKVEVVFELPVLNESISTFFDSIDAQPETTIIITRSFNLSGKSEIRVNGEAVTAKMLRDLTTNIVDIHGQHDHQALLEVKNHIKILDTLSDNIPIIKESLKSKLSQLKKLNVQIQDMGGEGEEKLKNIELLEHEIKEIELSEVTEGEEENLLEKRMFYRNSEKLSKNIYDAQFYLNNDDFSVLTQINNAVGALSQIASISNNVSETYDKLKSAVLEISTINEFLNDISSELNYSEAEANKVEERLDLIKDLKRKYGDSYAQIQEYLNNAKQKLFELQNSEELLKQINIEKQNILNEIYDISIKLTDERKLTASILKDRLLTELKDLDLQNADFKVAFYNDYSRDEIEEVATLDGADKVEFLFTANPGMELRSLTKVISGGELSRFMLAFKCVIKDDWGIKTLIFDEIDAGIGGMVAFETAKKLAYISKFNQVICITHLPQIACFAKAHYKIEKTVDNNYTTSAIKILSNEDDIIEEISRMMGLSGQSKSIETSRELIEYAKNFKLNL